MDPLRGFSTKETTQTEPIPGEGMIQNSAGGYVYEIDDFSRLLRFLILGTDGGTYYVSERKLTADNAKCVMRCIETDGKRTVDLIREVSVNARAPKNDPALFALAMAASAKNVETRKYALEALRDVARIGTHLLHFAAYVEQFRGWGRSLKAAIRAWYDARNTDDLAFQFVKYQSRDGWSERDLLRLSHPLARNQNERALFEWVTKGTISEDLPGIVKAFEAAKNAKTPKEVAALVTANRLSREMVPTEFLKTPEVWAALVPVSGYTAILRNLGVMGACGYLKPISDASTLVAERIADTEAVRKSKVHPIQILSALKVYSQGHGERGSLSWSPVPNVIDALDSAFYVSFGNVEKSGKKTMLGLDVSGSMCSGTIAGVPGITPRIGAAAMAMATAHAEDNYYAVAFSHNLVEFPLSKKERLDDVIQRMQRIPMGGTDCSLPMLAAIEAKLDVDTFLVYTDNETWAGRVHPSQALRKYRALGNMHARSAVVGMTATQFSIADPADPGMLDVVGFDSGTPSVISQFSKGSV